MCVCVCLRETCIYKVDELINYNKVLKYDNQVDYDFPMAERSAPVHTAAVVGFGTNADAYHRFRCAHTCMLARPHLQTWK